MNRLNRAFPASSEARAGVAFATPAFSLGDAPQKRTFPGFKPPTESKRTSFPICVKEFDNSAQIDSRIHQWRVNTPTMRRSRILYVLNLMSIF
jgi:hypothetical protein